MLLATLVVSGVIAHGVGLKFNEEVGDQTYVCIIWHYKEKHYRESSLILWLNMINDYNNKYNKMEGGKFLESSPLHKEL